MPRSATRARLHAEAVHRGDAIRRQRALEAAHATNNVASSATNNSSANASTTTANNNNTPPAAVPYNYSNFQVQRPLVTTNAPHTNVTEKVKSDLPRPQPITEASGPEYNDRDPLLNYQREQAEKGNPESQYAMGVRYLNGTGVDQSDSLAREWLEKASAGGNLKARARLREMDNAH
jgi:TPR repeat protein